MASYSAGSENEPLGSKQRNILRDGDAEIFNLEEDEPEVWPKMEGAEGSVPVEALDDAVSESSGSEGKTGEALTEEALSGGLHHLSKTANGDEFAYLHLALAGYAISEASLIGQFVHLQRIELPYNRLTEISFVESLAALLELDVSHNVIVDVTAIRWPANLRLLDVSYNRLKALPDMTMAPFLQKLNASNNEVSQVDGVSTCSRLDCLDLSHNQLRTARGLERLPVKNLNLCGNQLVDVEPLGALSWLQETDVSENQITSLHGLQHCRLLSALNLEGNNITTLEQVCALFELRFLRDLNLRRNPISEVEHYRWLLLFHLPWLVSLDRRRASPEEKVKAESHFQPSEDTIASRDHVSHLVYSFLEPCRLRDCTLPSMDTPYPILALCGPRKVGKRVLGERLLEDFSHYFGAGVIHCSEPHDKNRFIDSLPFDFFEAAVRQGQFVLTYPSLGQWYGLMLTTLDRVAREGLASMVCLQLQGALCLKQSYFEPRLVLVLTETSQELERRLRTAGSFSEAEIAVQLRERERCIEIHQERPGFFDAVLVADDLEASYDHIKALVRSYLQLPSPGTTPNRPVSHVESRSLAKRSAALREVLSGTRHRSSKRPVSDTAAGSAPSREGSRPGSGRLPVLPPIRGREENVY